MRTIHTSEWEVVHEVLHVDSAPSDSAVPVLVVLPREESQLCRDTLAAL
ncbi:hypothetical protein [Lentzea jiangxiensis]|uniref:Uncharacterized protein n=1 Tax=Lentzea jiangxiensis TaxID=641025 RepID=A0A1H0KP19_9PSEU|nr:hypothetical protein [Lentzea jiangxiensis]SDO57510.1 hypothetical protein SAMN05421507_10311 [Lentzea jiangxiensis]